MKALQTWPEPIIRVQSLSESGITAIPEGYVRPLPDRPCVTAREPIDNIPIIDLSGLLSGNSSPSLQEETLRRISCACREWGFFQVVNHGVSAELMSRSREVWREFFCLPLEEKQAYANTPATYEGYGSRLGIEKDVKLDWNDYFYLHYRPKSLMDEKKWPARPSSCREVTEEYGRELSRLCGVLMKAFSVNLGLDDKYLEKAFGGEETACGGAGACMRVNYYPKCPQPDLTLGLSSHSDPGGMTILLPDDKVSGLQVRKGDAWVTVKPVPDALVVNIGDQIQVLSNANYKSVEHRVTVNSSKERISLAFFYNPNGDILIQPAKELITDNYPVLYPPMTFNQYRVFIRTKGPCGKSQVESLKSPRS